ncbi:hypothetical protein KY337_05135 [Candidatus Woesearchaeota archaeon]|nr:hypothetical protein [Candidatus Woesearchaeota archaeon]
MLETLLDVNRQLVLGFQERFKENLVAVIGYGSFFQQGLETRIQELTPQHFDPGSKECIKPDFILVYEEPDKFFEDLGEQAKWDQPTRQKQRELNTTINYYNFETGPFEVALPRTATVKIPYKIGVISFEGLQRGCSSESNLYLSGRLSKVLYPQHINPGYKDVIPGILSQVHNIFLSKAVKWLPDTFTGEELLLAYVGMSYYSEAFRFDFMKKPQSILDNSRPELKDMLLPVIEAYLHQHPEISVFYKGETIRPDDIQANDLEGYKFAKPIKHVEDRLGNFIDFVSHNYHALRTTLKQWSTNKAVRGDNIGYIWRKVKKLFS